MNRPSHNWPNWNNQKIQKGKKSRSRLFTIQKLGWNQNHLLYKPCFNQSIIKNKTKSKWNSPLSPSSPPPLPSKSPQKLHHASTWINPMQSSMRSTPTITVKFPKPSSPSLSKLTLSKTTSIQPHNKLNNSPLLPPKMPVPTIPSTQPSSTHLPTKSALTSSHNEQY